MTPPSRVISRRAAIALGLAAAAGLTLRSRPAQAGEITVGDLVFEVPPDVVPADPSDQLGRTWQWYGRTDDNQLRPRGVVLARADLGTAEPVEVLGLLLASTASGLLPRSRSPVGAAAWSTAASRPGSPCPTRWVRSCATEASC